MTIETSSGNNDASMWGGETPAVHESRTPADRVRPLQDDEGTYPPAEAAQTTTKREMGSQAIPRTAYWGPSRKKVVETDTPDGLTYSA